MSFVVGQGVSWDRGDLPRGTGVVVEVKTFGVTPVYMVRDPMGNVHGFQGKDLT